MGRSSSHIALDVGLVYYFSSNRDNNCSFIGCKDSKEQISHRSKGWMTKSFVVNRPNIIRDSTYHRKKR